MTVQCSICFKELSDPVSMIAGIGPECHKKIRFSERLQPTELLSIAGGKSAPRQANLDTTWII